MAVTYKKDYSGWQGVKTYDSTTGLYTDEFGNNTFNYFNNNAVVGDILYVTSFNMIEATYDSVLFYVGTAMAGTGIVITPEYYNGTSWVTIVDYNDETNQFTSLGAKRFSWDITKQTSWTVINIDGRNDPWVRFRISALTTITNGGAQSTQVIFRGVDRFHIEDYLSTVPCTFADMYSADIAGTFNLMNRTGVSATDGAVVNDTYSLRPTDEVVMGGAKNNLYLTVANFTGLTNMTVQLSGTNEAGNAQTEDIVVTANGQYNSVKLWKTLTGSQTTVVTGTGSLDYTVTQGKWGIIGKSLTSYTIDRAINFYNSYFEDTNTRVIINEYLYHNRVGTLIFGFYNAGTLLSYLTFGVVTNSVKRETDAGIDFFINNYNGGYSSLFPYHAGHIRLYSCTFNQRYKRDTTSSLDVKSTSLSQTRIWNCVFKNNIQCGMRGINNDVDIYNVNAIYNSVLVRRTDGNTKISHISGINVGIGVWYQNYAGIVNGLWGRGITDTNRIENVGASDCYDINFDIDIWAINWAGTNSGKLYRQNSLNIRVCDASGNPITNARVILSKIGEIDIEALTNSNGDIVDSTFARIDGISTTTTVNKLIDSSATFITSVVRRGQYIFNKTTFKFSYVVSVDSETQITLRDDIFVSGDTYFIDGCILTYGYYDAVNGSVIQNVTGWDIKVIKSGYKTHEGIIVINTEINSTIAMMKSNLNLSKSVRVE